MLKKYGFSLVELLIAIAVISIIGGVGAVYVSSVPSSPVVLQEGADVAIDTNTKTPEVSEGEINKTFVPEVSAPPATPAAEVKPIAKPSVATQTPAPSAPAVTQSPAPKPVSAGKARIIFLHHSTGSYVYEKGTPEYLASYNSSHGTQYNISEKWYPSTNGNYPYDYWNIWVKNGQDLDAFAASNDVIIFKHCYPVSGISADNGNPDISSAGQTIANYKLQYAALKAKMKQYPTKKFIVWTGAALNSGSTNPGDAQRAKEFFAWVKNTWDEPGDNIFIWDFYNLETEGSLYMKDAYASSAGDPHPNPTFSKTVAPYFGQRIIDVIEGRGDTGSVTGK